MDSRCSINFYSPRLKQAYLLLTKDAPSAADVARAVVQFQKFADAHPHSAELLEVLRYALEACGGGASTGPTPNAGPFSPLLTAPGNAQLAVRYPHYVWYHILDLARSGAAATAANGEAQRMLDVLLKGAAEFPDLFAASWDAEIWGRRSLEQSPRVECRRVAGQLNQINRALEIGPPENPHVRAEIIQRREYLGPLRNALAHEAHDESLAKLLHHA